MWLDFNGSEARWSYSWFNRFRVRLAEEIGIILPLMEWFRTEEYDKMLNLKDMYFIPKTPLKRDNIQDNIVPLLNHSDCDWILSPEDCKKIYPRLKELIKNWDEKDSDRINWMLLAEWMEQCSESNENLEFM